MIRDSSRREMPGISSDRIRRSRDTEESTASTFAMRDWRATARSDIMTTMTLDPTLRIDAARFWSTVMRSGEIGRGKAGGLRRLALTDADKEMRDLFVAWCTETGCTVAVDRVGNIFARRPGTDDHLAPVLIGSHLDTQMAGGKYDGIVGVLAGLEILRTLDERRIRTRRPLELVCWTNEEGARFTPPMVASGAFS